MLLVVVGQAANKCVPPRLKALFPRQGSLKGCFRNVKAQGSHVDLKRMSSSGVSFGCDSDLLVKQKNHQTTKNVTSCWLP